MSITQKRNDRDTAFFCPEFLYPDAPNNSYKTLRRDVLDSFPGIWFVTADADGELVVTASENYWQKARGNWFALPSKKLPNGLVIHWLIRPLPKAEVMHRTSSIYNETNEAATEMPMPLSFRSTRQCRSCCGLL